MATESDAVKIVSGSKSDLGLPTGAMVPAGGSVEVTPEEADRIAAHPVCAAWLADGALMIEKPRKRAAKADSEG